MDKKVKLHRVTATMRVNNVLLYRSLLERIIEWLDMQEWGQPYTTLFVLAYAFLLRCSDRTSVCLSKCSALPSA